MSLVKSMQRIKELIQRQTGVRILILIVCFLYLPLWISSIFLASHRVSLHNIPFVPEDSSEYFMLAESLSDGYFQLPEYAYPETFRVPGYPLFLLATSFFGFSYFISTLIQILLTLFTAYVIFKIAEKYIPQKYAILSGVLYLLSPLTISYSLLGFSEVLFNFLLISIFYILVSSQFFGSRKFILLGVLWGCSVLVRPVALYFILIFIPLLVYEMCMKKKYEIKNLLLLLISFVCIVFPWSWRNHEISGKYSISNLQEFNLIYYNLSMYKSLHKGVSIENVRSDYEREMKLPRGEWRDMKYRDTLSKFALNDLKDNIVSYSIFHIAKIPQLFLSSSIETALIYAHYTLDIPFDRSGSSVMDYILQGDWSSVWVNLMNDWWKLFERMLLIIVYISALLGVWKLKDIKLKTASILFIGYFAFLTGPVALARYRVPIEPFIFIFSSIGLYYMPMVFRSIIDRYPKMGKVIRYLISGGFATVLDLVLLYILADIVGMWYLLSAIIAFIIAFVASFVLQKYWTFRDREIDTLHQQVGSYLLIALINLGINTLLVFAFVHYMNFYHIFAQVLASGLVALSSFFLYQRFVFKKNEQN